MVATNPLKQQISQISTLLDLLKLYAGADSLDNALKTLLDNDVIWSMGDQNGMNANSMVFWIMDHCLTSVDCDIIQENGSAGGWPVVKVSCMDKTFFFDWAY